MINTVKQINTTAGMSRDELHNLLNTVVGVFIVDTTERETRFVFAASKGSYRIKYLGNSWPNYYTKEVKKLLSRSYDVRYEGSVLSIYYEHLCDPTDKHEISIVDIENKPVNVGSTYIQSLKDFK